MSQGVAYASDFASAGMASLMTGLGLSSVYGFLVKTNVSSRI
jgi:hypothetical protein